MGFKQVVDKRRQTSQSKNQYIRSGIPLGNHHYQKAIKRAAKRRLTTFK